MYAKYIKRLLDIVLSACALVVLSPVYLAIVIAIKLDSPGPALFWQKRVGTRKSYFYLFKFRTMSIHAPHDVPTHLLPDPDRWITRVGRFLRRTSLDELPQIAQVFSGKMSIIGPRPALWNQYDLIAERDRYGANDVRPGLSGWAQINGRDSIEIPDKARLDGEYAANISFGMDWRCFWGTVISVLRQEGVVEGDRLAGQGDHARTVSIITPAYNAERYIADTIESVLQQTLADWELLIVDDCSTDGTADIVTRYMQREPRIRLIRQAKNGGVAQARNAGLDQARGRYMAFLDSDDLWLPEKLERQVAFMERYGYAITYTRYQYLEDKTGQTGKIVRVPRRMTPNSILRNTSIGCLTVMVDRETTGRFHMPDLPHTEDQCTWYEITRRGYVAYALNENLALYRRSRRSLTGNRRHAARLQWQTYRHYLRFSFPKSCVYFICYAVTAVCRHFL